MIEALDDYNWESVFEFAGEPSGNTASGHDSVVYSCSVSDHSFGFGSPKPHAVAGADVDTSPFARADVAEIIGMSDGEKDERSWVIAGRLEDGRWFSIRASCDYTGWG